MSVEAAGRYTLACEVAINGQRMVPEAAQRFHRDADLPGLGLLLEFARLSLP